MRVRFPRIAFLFACAVSLALPLAAQSPNGTINGRVLDPSNRVIGGADILVINDATGVKYSGKTNDDGIYGVPNLPPGPYRLQVSKVGFKTLIKPDVILNIQDALSINFTLPIGAVFEIVTVEGGAPLVNTESAAVSTVIDQAYVKNMPLNGRSFQDLILLTPGIVTNSPQSPSAVGQTGEFSVNGQRTESNYYTVDGVSANVGATAGALMTVGAGASGSVAASTALGTTQALVSVDDLQEFRVQSSSYSAEYGRNPGGQFAFETKSGTNQWHGTAYDYLRNNFFDAPDYFTDYLRPLNPTLTNPAVRQNDFGGTFGGPVKIPGLYQGKDRTFFFFSYEGLRLTQPQPALVNYVPDAHLRASAPAPLNQVLSAFPVPNGQDFGDGIAEYIGSWSNPSSLDSTSVRFDHVVNDKHRLFFRFSDTSSYSSVRGDAVGQESPAVTNVSSHTARTYTAGVTSAFSSRISNEFRLNYSSNEATARLNMDAFGGSTPVDLASLSGLGSGASVVLGLFYDGYVAGVSGGQQAGGQKQWNLVDAVSLSLGHHQFKFGLDYRRLTPFAVPINPFGEYVYLSESNLENNNAFDVGEANGPAYPLYTNFSAFAQDEWKVSQHLNLSLGIRWEVNPAPGVTQGLKPYTAQGASPTTMTLAPQGTPLWQTTYGNFAPRLGAAYVLRDVPGRETVVRGGGGVFFDTGQQLGSQGFNGPGFSASNINFSGPFPGGAVIPTIPNPPVLPYQGVLYAFAPHLQLPYTLQWNASIEQALGKSQVLTVSYVGSHATRLLQTNQFSNPNAIIFLLAQNGLTSDYGALQTQFKRRLTRGLTALASYTWSHCLDYGSVNYEIGYQRGNCDFDVRHSLSAAFSYDVPNVGHNDFVEAVLHHWGIDDRFTARTPFPVTLNGTTFFNPAGQEMVNGLDLVSGQPIYLYGANCDLAYSELYGNTLPCPGGRAINPCAFVNVGSTPAAPCPTNGTVVGLARRNFARGFDAVQMDLAMRREFPIHERLKLQFRAEAFNIFNHPNFGTINSNLGQNTFGQATATLAQSLGVLSPLYQQGGARSMQFALKLIF